LKVGGALGWASVGSAAKEIARDEATAVETSSARQGRGEGVCRQVPVGLRGACGKRQRRLWSPRTKQSGFDDRVGAAGQQRRMEPVTEFRTIWMEGDDHWR
jgi:hypothetical protein